MFISSKVLDSLGSSLDWASTTTGLLLVSTVLRRGSERLSLAWLGAVRSRNRTFICHNPASKNDLRAISGVKAQYRATASFILNLEFAHDNCIIVKSSSRVERTVFWRLFTDWARGCNIWVVLAGSFTTKMQSFGNSWNHNPSCLKLCLSQNNKNMLIWG